MTFKQNWEKTNVRHQLPVDVVRGMVKLAYPDKKLTSHSVISGGRTNLTIKINLDGDKNPLLLRVYLHDLTAVNREQNIGILLKQTVPVPLTHYVGNYGAYRFAIMEFMPGITLRDLLLGNSPHDVGDIMYEVGALLAKITTNTFPNAGFFDKDLQVMQEFGYGNIREFSLNRLKHFQVQQYLSAKAKISIERLLKQLPDLPNTEVTLVHADFDPTNILVEQIKGVWRVTGILNWKFAYAGSWLDDVATMLRYAHEMPPIFEEAFIKGLLYRGKVFPENWRLMVLQHNLSALLESMARYPLHIRPNTRGDICALIERTVLSLEAR